MLLPGRILFAVAMVGFGVLCVVAVDFVNQLQPVNQFLPASTPGYGFLAVLTGVLLIAAGVLIMADAMVRPAALALTTLFALWIVFLQIPSAFVSPSLLRSPWWVRTFETVALTGAALILAARTSSKERVRWSRVGQVLFGVSLPVFGILHFIYAENTATLVPAIFPWPLFWIYVTGTGNVAAGVAIVTGTLSRLAAILAGIMYGTYALTLHIPRSLTLHLPAFLTEDPVAFQRGRGGLTSLFVAIGMSGAAWIVASSLRKRDPVVAEKELTMANAGADAEP
jgi:uncharacterized membrane protein YphA (DoxX/SURF4 family)